MFYLTTHSTHFIYGYMVSGIWLRSILIVRKETRCHHMGYSYRLTARVLLYAPSHRQDNTYHGLCYTSRGALAGTRSSSMGPPMKDRSDDPSHHERTLYLWATSRSQECLFSTRGYRPHAAAVGWQTLRWLLHFCISNLFSTAHGYYIGMQR